MKKVRIKVVDTLSFEGEIPLSAYPDGATVEVHRDALLKAWGFDFQQPTSSGYLSRVDYSPEGVPVYQEFIDSSGHKWVRIKVDSRLGWQPWEAVYETT